jgi:hypothetical protein
MQKSMLGEVIVDQVQFEEPTGDFPHIITQSNWLPFLPSPPVICQHQSVAPTHPLGVKPQK